jgi:hypothetical protein
MNRPFGAVDVAANLKGAVPKATTQKILVALAEKGEVVQKTYGTYRSVTKTFSYIQNKSRENELCHQSGQHRLLSCRQANRTRARVQNDRGKQQRASSGDQGYYSR